VFTVNRSFLIWRDLMIRKRLLIGILLVTMLLAIVPALSIAAPPAVQPVQEDPTEEPAEEQSTELLKNPGFEGISCRAGSVPPECLDNWSNSANHDGSFHDNIFTPQGWTTWWRKGGDFGQPEVKTIPNVPPFTGELPRIRSGFYAVLMFTYYRLQDMGLYQVVTGLEPGSTVQLSAYAHGWSCDDKKHKLGYSCGDAWNQRFQVGIEPNGAADPFSSNIVWSQEQAVPDHYQRIGPVTAQVGAGGKVTAILRSKTKWMYVYQDAYWDDASMVMTSPGTPPTDTPPPPPPPPTAGPPPAPLATPTPRPDGAIVHIVQAGDTIFGIALMYGVDPDQIRQLNAGSIGAGDLIQVGQELVISLPSQTSTPTPPSAPPTPASAAEGEAPATEGGAVTEGASICVLAYHDRNGNTFQDEETEELLPNAEFTLADASGVIGRYTSDGVSEPYCFTGLAPGAYRVIQTAPPGYAPSGPAEWPVGVAEETSIEVGFGNVRGESEEGSEEATEAAPENEEESDQGETSGGSTVNRIFSTVAKISGVLVLLLAAGMAALFVVNRRRM
jgi:hypothetical protein